MSTKTNYRVAEITGSARASIRAELTNEWDQLTQHEHQVSNVVAKQFVETAIHGIDAVDRVAALADRLAGGKGTSADNIGWAIATEIRNALKGI